VILKTALDFVVSSEEKKDPYQKLGSNMAAPKITLYYDIVSPFAHIAFHILRVSISLWHHRGAN
jgi:lipopolysaccharide export LptBFGC system permease protein LptF